MEQSEGPSNKLATPRRLTLNALPTPPPPSVIPPRAAMVARALVTLALASFIHGKQFDFVIDKQWNGTSTGQPAVKITLIENLEDDTMTFMVKAPFYNDTKPDGDPAEPNDDMWQKEAGEVYFLNDNDEYVTVQIGPFAHYLVTFFKGERREIEDDLTLEVEATISDQMWEAKATIPGAYLPPRAKKFNAFMLNGPLSARRYWALYPEGDATDVPDFRHLGSFRPIAMEGSYAKSDATYSDVWLDAIDSSATEAVGIHLLILSLAFLLLKCH